MSRIIAKKFFLSRSFALASHSAILVHLSMARTPTVGRVVTQFALQLPTVILSGAAGLRFFVPQCGTSGRVVEESLFVCYRWSPPALSLYSGCKIEVELRGLRASCRTLAAVPEGRNNVAQRGSAGNSWTARQSPGRGGTNLGPPP